MSGIISNSARLRFKNHVFQRAISSMAQTLGGQGKKEGDISSVFVSLSGAKAEPLPQRFAKIKQDILRNKESKITASWSRLLERLSRENQIIAEGGSSIILQIDYNQLGSDPNFETELKKRGVAVIRGVVPENEARRYKEDIENYIKRNPSTKAFPPNDPQVFELYWSPSQVRARGHANLLKTQKYLMSIWHPSRPDAPISTSIPLTYADRVRIRQPGDSSFALGPHMDGGSTERWEPNGYGIGGVYDAIFDGRWEDYNPFESSGRIDAVTDLYNGPGGCSMFRMFQGWLSMSYTGPGEGTLLVHPLLQLSTAYMLLRPFFSPRKPAQRGVDPQFESDFLESSNWALDDPVTTDLHGAALANSQELNTLSHPHLNLSNTMVHVPRIRPGDYVAWHCDSIHAVDKTHAGQSDSSVLYIPVCPMTESNMKYLVRQKENFEQGIPAPDFPGGQGESKHIGRANEQFAHKHLSNDALRAMGLEGYPLRATIGEEQMMQLANRMLGF